MLHLMGVPQVLCYCRRGVPVFRLWAPPAIVCLLPVALHISAWEHEEANSWASLPVSPWPCPQISQETNRTLPENKDPDSER